MYKINISLAWNQERNRILGVGSCRINSQQHRGSVGAAHRRRNGISIECSIGCVSVCVVLRHKETVESSTLPENGNNPISRLTQNKTGNKGEQPIALQCVLGSNTERENGNDGVDKSGEMRSVPSHT